MFRVTVLAACAALAVYALPPTRTSNKNYGSSNNAYNAYAACPFHCDEDQLDDIARITVTQSQLETDVYAWVQKAKFLNDAMDILEISVGQCLNTAPVQPAYPAYPGAAYNPGYGGTPTTGAPNIYGAGADEGANTVEGAGASFKSDKASGFSGIGYGNFYSYGPDCSALLSQLTRLQDQLCAAEFYLSQLIDASIQGTKDRNDIMLSCKDESTPGKVCPRECSDVSDCRECGKTCDLRSGSRNKNKCVKRDTCPNTCTNDDSCSVCGKTKCSGSPRKCS